MSFSSQIKREITKNLMDDHPRDCELSELAAILENCADISPVSIRVKTENAPAIYAVYTLVEKCFNVSMEVRGRYGLKGSKVRSYEAYLLDRDIVPDVLDELRDNAFSQNEPGEGARWYLRGAFLGNGSVSNPEGAYHMEIVSDKEAYAERLRRLLAGYDIDAKILTRNRTAKQAQYVLYLKDGDLIVDFLNVIGAHGALLEMENTRALKEMRSQVNRQVNCETANLAKTANSAAVQLTAIRKLMRSGKFSQLSEPLQETARLRMEHPEASLEELCRLSEEPIGKSGMNHRLQKLVSLAENKH